MIPDERSPWLMFMGMGLRRPGGITVALAMGTAITVAALLVLGGRPESWTLGGRLLLGSFVGSGVLVHRCGASLRGPTAFRALLLAGLLTAPWWWVLALTV